jgi:hypothetical protein
MSFLCILTKELCGYTGRNTFVKREIDYYLPIEVDHDNKTYSMMGNVTAAAAARQKGVLSTGEDLYSFFDI